MPPRSFLAPSMLAMDAGYAHCSLAELPERKYWMLKYNQMSEELRFALDRDEFNFLAGLYVVPRNVAACETSLAALDVPQFTHSEAPQLLPSPPRRVLPSDRWRAGGGGR